MAGCGKKYDFNRIYVSVERSLALAGVIIPTNSEIHDKKFYLDLDGECWVLADDKAVDDALRVALNALAQVPEFIEADKGRQTEEQAETATDEYLKTLSDDELIDLVRRSPEHEWGNVWAGRLSRLPGLSTKVILAIVEISPNWHRSKNLLAQENFPEQVWKRGLQLDRKHHWGIVTKWAGLDLTTIVDYIAHNYTTKDALGQVGANKTASFETLMHVREQGVEATALLTHPETPTALLVEFAKERAYARVLVRQIADLPDEVVEALLHCGHGEARHYIVDYCRHLVTPELLDEYARCASSDLILKIIRNKLVSTETLNRLMTHDDRISVQSAAFAQLKKLDRQAEVTR